jgi:glucokinase
MILAGDIGGTNTRVALFESERGPAGVTLRPAAEVIYPSRQHAGLEEIVEHFQRQHSRPVTAACFGIAGPVLNGRSVASNLPWVVESASLARMLGLPSCGLINDLEANAWGLRTLEPADFLVLNEGNPNAVGNQGLISAGTGLGEAGLYWDGQTHRPFACEGGHCDYAPRTDREIELLRHLRSEFGGHVSYERVVSGMGLVNVWKFITGPGYDAAMRELMVATHTPDPGAAITRAGLAGTEAASVEALDLFVSAYGAEAGNLALKVMATGGLYIGGGIAPKILPKLREKGFLEAFADKGRFGAVMRSIPVRVVLNDRTALRGAARYAADHSI